MSSKGQNIIEINGKRYDARSGHLLHTSSAETKSIDGFTRRPASHSPAKSAHKQSAHHTTTAAHHVHKKTEKSKTLMRTAVKKPASLSHHSPEPKLHTAIAMSKPLLPTHALNPGRVLRAGHIKQSHLVSKFGKGLPGALHIKTVPLPVQPSPKDVPVLPLDNLIHHSAGIDTSGHRDHFAQALASAHSHMQPKLKSKNRIHHRAARRLRVSTRALNITAGLTATLLIVGFFAYQNIPNFAMRIASSQSGVHGKFPGYQPAGFGISGPIEYQEGQIVVNFKSNTDERSFKVVQESSDWTSETLLSSLSDGDKKPQSLLRQGKTIYLYDDNAAWVSGGVKYHIEGSAGLNSDQLVRLATSL